MIKCFSSKNSVLLKLNLSIETGWILTIFLIIASNNIKTQGFWECQCVHFLYFWKAWLFFPALDTLSAAVTGPTEQAVKRFVPNCVSLARLGKSLSSFSLLVISLGLWCCQTPCHKVRSNGRYHFKTLLPWTVIKTVNLCRLGTA